MGKGDIRTRKGKIIAGSFGNTRPKPKKKVFAKTEVESAPVEKTERKRKIKVEKAK
jgi:ribosomal small subunit protein bTHX